MKRKFFVILGFAILLFGAVLVLKMQNIGTALVWQLSNEGAWLFPLVAVSALIDSVNPCAFSILLLTIAFLLSIGKSRSGVLKIGGIYILGIFTVYILIGLGIIQALHIFNTPHFMGKLGAVLLVILGAINVIGQFYPSFPIKLKIPQAAHQKMASLMGNASLGAAFFLGALVGLCEFPCTGGPYLMVLGLLHDSTTYLTGVMYLLLYNLIFIIPLVTILLIASEKGLLEKVQAWQRSERSLMRLGGGGLMIALGIIIFFFF